jgi:hypothetical protein
MQENFNLGSVLCVYNEAHLQFEVPVKSNEQRTSSYGILFFCKKKNLLDTEDLHYDIAFAELKCMDNFTILNTHHLINWITLALVHAKSDVAIATGELKNISNLNQLIQF